MQIFEFHFNPKKGDKVFDSFVFEPENIYEKKVGNLCIAGEITNILSQNYQLLNNLVSVIKKGYYQLSPRISPLGALKKGLEDANKFLEKEEKEGNISWLGNLNIAVISIKELSLNFTKTGTIKILLARGKKIIDIGKEIEDKNAKSPSLKTFSNILSGKLIPNDKLLILTKEIFDVFLKEGAFSEILLCLEKHKEKRLDKRLRHIFNKYKKNLANVAALFLLISQQIPTEKPKEIKEISLPQRKPILALSSLVGFPRKYLSTLQKIVVQRIIVSKISKIKAVIKNKGKIPIFSKIRRVFIYLSDLSKEVRKKRILSKRKVVSISNISVKRAVVLTFILIAVVGTGFYISQTQKQKHIQEIQTILAESQEIVKRADDILQKNPGKANLLLQEAWQKISIVEEEKEAFLKNEINDFKKSLKEKLFLLNKVEYVSPQFVYELKEDEFFPQRIFVFGKKIYFFKPNSNRIYRLDIINKKGEFINLRKEAKLASQFQDHLVFLYSNNKVSLLENHSQEKNLSFPYYPVNINCLSSFGKNLYMFDSAKKEIIKFRVKQGLFLNGTLWFNQKTERPSAARSMAIDGSIWIVDKDNNLWRFFKGDLRDKIILNIFPFIQQVTRISTNYSLPYLYLLEPIQKRIIILDKNGETVKQFLSNEFNNLKDISIDNNGVIYILNENKLYKIQL